MLELELVLAWFFVASLLVTPSQVTAATDEETFEHRVGRVVGSDLSDPNAKAQCVCLSSPIAADTSAVGVLNATGYFVGPATGFRSFAEEPHRR